MNEFEIAFPALGRFLRVDGAIDYQIPQEIVEVISELRRYEYFATRNQALSNFYEEIRIELARTARVRNTNEFKLLCWLVFVWITPEFNKGILSRSRNNYESEIGLGKLRVLIEQSHYKSVNLIDAMDIKENQIYGSGISKLLMRYENAKKDLISTLMHFEEYQRYLRSRAAIFFELCQYDKSYESKEFLMSIEKDIISLKLPVFLKPQIKAEKIWSNYLGSKKKWKEKGTSINGTLNRVR